MPSTETSTFSDNSASLVSPIASLQYLPFPPLTSGTSHGAFSPSRMDGQKPNSDPAAHNKSASTETVFLPRSEFWRAPVTPHSFALLSFNGNEILRLANCPDNVVSAVRRALPQGDIRHFREDPDLLVCEFLLAGKPFSGRSVKYAVYHCLTRPFQTHHGQTRQEQLLLNIFTAIMSQNYSLVTSIDYGRIYVSASILRNFNGVKTSLSSAGQIDTCFRTCIDPRK